MENYFVATPNEPDENTEMYTLRVHTSSDELLIVAKWLREHAVFCLVVQEMASRVHFHGIFSTRKNINQWRKDFKKQFPHLMGNKHYSLKDVKSQIGIKDYLCKGGETLGEMPVILERSPYWTDELILKHHTSYHERHMPEVAANLAAKQGSDSIISDNAGRTRVRTPTVPEKVASILLKEYPEKEWRFNDQIDRTIVYRRMMRTLGEAGKSFDLIVLKRLYNGILHQLCEVESTEFFEHLLVNL